MTSLRNGGQLKKTKYAPGWIKKRRNKRNVSLADIEL